MRWLVLTVALRLAAAAAWVLLGVPGGPRPNARSEVQARARAGDQIGSASREALREILRRADSGAHREAADSRAGEH